MAAPENLLRHETSPYLLQHADNPVHWRPWGPAALAEATADKQADPAVDRLCRLPLVPRHGARVLRGSGDRGADERALRQHQGGPRGAAGHRPPVHVGAARDGRAGRLAADHVPRAGWRAVLGRHVFPAGAALGPAVVPPGAARRVGRLAHRRRRWWRRTPPRCAARWSGMSTANPGDLPTPVHLDAVAAALLRLNDPEHGGLQGAPKFPNPPIFRFLWQNAFRTGAPEGQEALHLMLQRMSQGGIYDHLGGGYARYSTDAVWLVPHFEKMLYDNAQLLELLALAHAHRPDPLYAAARRRDGRLDGARHDGRRRGRPRRLRRIGGRRQRGRGGPVLRLDRGGGGRAAGRRSGCVQARLRRDAGRQLGGPHDPAPGHAARLGGGRRRSLARSRAVLFEARAQRVRPGRDDKVLADWNGLAIAALARAAGGVRAAGLARPRRGGARFHPGGDVGAGRPRAARLAAGPRDGSRPAGRPGGDGAGLAGAVRGHAASRARLAQAMRLAEAALAAFADGRRRVLHHGRGRDRRAADPAAHRPRTTPRRRATGCWRRCSRGSGT